MTDLLATVPGLSNGQAPLPNVVTAGQPSAAEIAALGAAGVKTVLDLRMPHEGRGFDEAHVAEQAGLRYVNVPVQGMVSDEAFATVRRELQQSASAPLLYHCASANRVGGLMIPYLMLDLKQDQATALKTAQQVGLRDGMIAQQALDYVTRHG